jgi:serine/threonine protein phosphatase 1
MEPAEDAPPPAVPAGSVIYAIGDIHGRRDLLAGALDALRDAARAATASGQRVSAVFLGDYIDRGPASRGVIEDLMAFEAEAPCEIIFLRGNHEQVLLDVARGRDPGRGWLKHGGFATLESYGAALPPGEPRGELQPVVRAAVPASHLNFLNRTKLMARFGDYLFAHAGLRPDRLIQEQSPADLLWFRYYDDETPLHSATVVHGHSPNPLPVLGRHRIAIDTRAYATGALTLLRLEGTRKAFERVVIARDTLKPTLEPWTELDSAYRTAPRARGTQGRWETDDLETPARRSRGLIAAAVIVLAAAAAVIAFLSAGPVTQRPNAVAGGSEPRSAAESDPAGGARDG